MPPPGESRIALIGGLGAIFLGLSLFALAFTLHVSDYWTEDERLSEYAPLVSNLGAFATFALAATGFALDGY